MSLYNAVFGTNKLAPLLLNILGIDQPNSEWESGRFRDAYLNEDGTNIILVTRNGGGNRIHYDDEIKEGSDCRCPGCIIGYHLPKHPNYLRDYDDDFDSTYAYIVFSVPQKFKELTKGLGTGLIPKPVSEMFKQLLSDMQNNVQTEETQKVMNVAKNVLGKLEEIISNEPGKPAIIEITKDSGKETN